MDAYPCTPLLLRFLAMAARDMERSIGMFDDGLNSLPAIVPGKDAAAFAQMRHSLLQTRRSNDRLLDGLAQYERAARPPYPLAPRLIALQELTEQVVADTALLRAARGITLEVDAPPGLYWTLDIKLVGEVLSDAVHNALDHTRDKIGLRLALSDQQLEMRVEDNGPGFPQALLDAGQGAMSGNFRGVDFASTSTGLGLYFSRMALSMHAREALRGSLQLSNGGSYGGACFVARLP